MGRRRLTADLYVFMNGTRVGVLSRAATGQLTFRYTGNWMTDPLSRPISLSMPVREEAYRGDVVENFFDNLLPDNVQIRRRIQTRFKTGSDRAFDLLWHIGRDCVGALQLLPDNAEHIDVQRIESERLTNAEITRRLKEYQISPLGMAQEDDDFRISIAGAQEKTAFLWHEGAWHLPRSTTPTSHIFKLPIGRVRSMDLHDSVDNEYLGLKIVREFGLPAAQAEIADFDGFRVLVVERFDRRWAADKSWMIRLPQEDLCQAFNIPSAQKYESDGGPGMQRIMEFLLGSEVGIEDRLNFLKTQIVYWMLAAIDGHAKNFSVAITPGGGYRLTPLYDILSASPYIARGELSVAKAKMAMAVRGKNAHYVWDRIHYRHWMATARRCGVPLQQISDMIDLLIESCDSVVDRVSSSLPAGHSPETARYIFDRIKLAAEILKTGRSEFKE